MAGLRRSVAVLIDTSSSWGSNLIQGVARYAEMHGPWTLHLGQHGKHEVQRLPAVDPLDGCIARVTSAALAEALEGAGVPAVNVSWSLFGQERIPICTADGWAAGALAARYFLERGQVHFGYYGIPMTLLSRNDLVESFRQAVAAAGHETRLLTAARTGSEEGERLRRVTDWVLALEKPAAVLTYDALFGREVTEACRQARVRVPEDVSVLSAERDELFERLSIPRLSAIDLRPQHIGFEAARLLDRLMAGEPAPTEALLVPPGGIFTSPSTDTLAISDPVVRAALAFIRNHAADPIQVQDVVKHLALSRRLVEQRFRTALDRTLAEEIRRVRLERSRLLLEDPNLSIRAVATQSGFEYPEVFARVFRRTFGVSPSDYRQRGEEGGDGPTGLPEGGGSGR